LEAEKNNMGKGTDTPLLLASPVRLTHGRNGAAHGSNLILAQNREGCIVPLAAKQGGVDEGRGRHGKAFEVCALAACRAESKKECSTKSRPAELIGRENQIHNFVSDGAHRSRH
jgi:hypothetical protein